MNALFSADSLGCASVKPNELLQSTRDLGWKALLLDHHRGVGRADVFETHPTGDVSLVVGMRGRHLIQVLKQGRWQTAVYEEGAAGITAPEETTRMSWQGLDHGNAFETAHLYLPATLIVEMAEEYRRAGGRSSARPLSRLVVRDPVIATVARELMLAMQQDRTGIYAEQATRFLVAHLLAHHAGWWDRDSDHRVPAPLTNRQLARVLEFMSAHFGEDLTLAQLAAEACISVHHFVRRFREEVGTTPFAYLTELRLEAARRLLETTELDIAEVGRRCGYASPGAFSSAFRRSAGITPSAYRASSARWPLT